MKRIEVRLEELLMSKCPCLVEDDPSGGKLAGVVVDILKETNPEHRPYPDAQVPNRTPYDDFLDAYHGSSRPVHSSGATTCLCPDCKRKRGIADGLRAQSEAARFILNLKFLKWLIAEGRLTDEG